MSKQPEKDKKLKAIVVGNSPSVLNHEYGELIDGYDIVIRINRCPTEGYEKHIGSKIDIWATTRNTYYKAHDRKWVPKKYDKLKYVWHRTAKSQRRVDGLPKDLMSKKRSSVMYKRGVLRKNYKEYFYSGKSKAHGYELLDTGHELCTGLITIMYSTLCYEDVTIHGFTFYADQNDGKITAYYREKEAIDDKHPEDEHWEENKSSGFASEEVAKIKQDIVNDLVSKGKIKILQHIETNNTEE